MHTQRQLMHLSRQVLGGGLFLKETYQRPVPMVLAVDPVPEKQRLVERVEQTGKGGPLRLDG